MAAADQPDLFAAPEDPAPGSAPGRAPEHQPLAARMRPRSLSEIAGQEHITAPGSLLPRLVASNRFGSLIFYGPPGCGKTSFAEVIARETGARVYELDPVVTGPSEPEAARGAWLAAMEKNLAVLRDALR